jgi:F0F1-type ATP synthase membrane subunit b/b'
VNDQALVALISTLGPAGTFVVVVGLVVRYLYRQVIDAKQQVVETQEKRVQDAQASTTRLLSLAEAQHKQIELLTAAINDSTSASREMRNAFESMAADRGWHRGFPSAPRRGG